MTIEVENPIRTPTSLSSALNKYGRMGWELVQIANLPINSQFRLLVIFKKPAGYMPFDDNIE